MRLPFSNGQKSITIVSTYAPTMTNPDEIKDKFYKDLNAIMTTVPSTDKLINLGDFNVRVGSDSTTWEGVIGQYGVGNYNSNGLFLLQTCAEHGLWITNTIFHLPTANRASGMHPNSKHWQCIDYVIIRKRNRQDVQVTRAMCGTKCWTDHCLIISKLNLCIQPKRPPQGMKTPKHLNVNKLKLSCIKEFLINTLEEGLDATMLDNQDVELAWEALHAAVYNTAMECLGPTTRKHKEWFDENSTEILQLLEDKSCAYRAHIDDLKSTAKKDVLRNINSTIQLKLYQMEDSWLSHKTDEIQGFADRNDMKNFYDCLKEVYGPTTSGSSLLLSADGSTLITDKEKILERLAEHFDNILNHLPTISDEAINWLPQVPFDEMLVAVPTFEEIWKVIHQLTSGKAPGADSIPSEVCKEGGTALTEKLQQLFQLIW